LKGKNKHFLNWKRMFPHSGWISCSHLSLNKPIWFNDAQLVFRLMILWRKCWILRKFNN
jgi:hypothetical protein